MATFKMVVESFEMNDLELLKGEHETEKGKPEHIILEEFFKRHLCEKTQIDETKETFKDNSQGTKFYDDILQQWTDLQRKMNAIVNKAVLELPTDSNTSVAVSTAPDADPIPVAGIVASEIPVTDSTTAPPKENDTTEVPDVDSTPIPGMTVSEIPVTDSVATPQQDTTAPIKASPTPPINDPIVPVVDNPKTFATDTITNVAK